MDLSTFAIAALVVVLYFVVAFLTYLLHLLGYGKREPTGFKKVFLAPLVFTFDVYDRLFGKRR